MDPVDQLLLSNVRLVPHGQSQPLLTIEHLELKGGLLYGVVGDNLSGRSSLLRAIGGGFLETSSDGTLGERLVVWRDAAIREQIDPRHHSVYLGPTARDSLSTLTSTVQEEIALHLRLGRNASDECLNALIRQFRLDELLTRDPMQLSGGQTAGLALVCAFLMGRAILCIDEMLAHLDIALRSKAWEACRTFARYGRVVLVADNQFDLMSEHVDRLVIMNDGHASASDFPVDAFRQEDLRRRNTIPTPTRLALELGIEQGDLPIQYRHLRNRLNILRQSWFPH